MMTTRLLHFISTLIVTNSELILDILFIHKFRDRLVKDAVLVNISREEICDHYWVYHETWEVWRVEEGRRVVTHVRTVHTMDNIVPMVDNVTDNVAQSRMYNRYLSSFPTQIFLHVMSACLVKEVIVGSLVSFHILCEVRMRLLSILLILSLLLAPDLGKLVLEKEEDLETLSQEDIFTKAVIISTSRRRSETCPDVEEEEQVYEYFVMVDGKEERREMEAVMRIDVVNTTRTVANIKEPWVHGQVVLRLVQ